MFIVAVKSGTSGYSDYDGCDLILAEVPSKRIPVKGDTLEFGDENNREKKRYLVTDIHRAYNFKTEQHDFGEWIYVYVIQA